MAFAGAVASLAGDVLAISAQRGVLLVGAMSWAYAFALWLLRPTAWQSSAMFGAVVLLACGAVATVGGGHAPTLGFALVLWGLGLVWALLGERHVLKPTGAVLPAGVALALFAPSIGIDAHGWLFAVGIATALGSMAASVVRREPPLLALGVIGLFAYVTGGALRYFAGSLGTPGALVVTGVVLLAFAVFGARWWRGAASTPTATSGAPSGSPSRSRPGH